MGGIREAVMVGNVPATEPAARGRTQIPLSSERAVFGEGKVESNQRWSRGILRQREFGQATLNPFDSCALRSVDVQYCSQLFCKVRNFAVPTF